MWLISMALPSTTMTVPVAAVMAAETDERKCFELIDAEIKTGL